MFFEAILVYLSIKKGLINLVPNSCHTRLSRLIIFIVPRVCSEVVKTAFSYFIDYKLLMEYFYNVVLVS